MSSSLDPDKARHYLGPDLVLFCLQRLSAEDKNIIDPVHEISNNVICATSKASDQPAHKRSLIRAFASCLNFL